MRWRDGVRTLAWLGVLASGPGLAGCDRCPCSRPDGWADRPVDAAAPDVHDLDADDGADVAMPTDLPAADVGCEDFSGAASVGGVCIPLGGATYGAICVRQEGCRVTVLAGGATLTGIATGDTTTVAASGTDAPTCTIAPSATGRVLRCLAPAQGLTCTGAVVALDVPGATRYCCDVGAQDCGDGRRCTLVQAGTTMMPACLPVRGTLAPGEACTRDMDRIGFDGCTVGAFCANTSMPARDRRACRRLCAGGSPCAAGEVCYEIPSVLRTGVCVPGCTLDAGACAMGMTCRSLAGFDATGARAYVGLCDAVGTTAAGGRCWDPAMCAAGLSCAADHTCQRACDDTHPCPSGRACATPGDHAILNPHGQGTCS